MRTLNKVHLIGRLGADPEIKVGGEIPVVHFSIATSERLPSGETVPEWHRITAFGKLAELCHEFLKKGRVVYIEGRLRTHSWDDEDGVRRNRTEIIAEEMIAFGESGRPQTVQEDQAPSDPPAVDSPQEDPESEEEDEAPTDSPEAEAPGYKASKRQVATIRKLAAKQKMSPEEIDRLVAQATSIRKASEIIGGLTKRVA